MEPTICAEVQLPVNRPHAVSFHGGICLTESNISIADMKDFCPDDGGFQGWDIPVRCSPLKSYMDEARAISTNHLNKEIGMTIDFMSIDVEGYYMSVLKTIPFDEYNIRVLVVECRSDECYNFLESKGYNILKAGSILHVGEDTIAWKNDC